MGSELEVLKKIWENEKKASVKLISGQTRLGLDYVRYLCNCLIKKKQIKLVRKKPGWYRITAKGKKELKLRAIFKPKILKVPTAKPSRILDKVGKDKGIRKVILPWPKRSLKVPRRGAKGKEIPVEEKKLRLGKMIERTISFLRASTFPAKLRTTFRENNITKQTTQKVVRDKGRKRGKRALLRRAVTKAAMARRRQGYGGQGKRKKYVKKRKIKSS